MGQSVETHYEEVRRLKYSQTVFNVMIILKIMRMLIIMRMLMMNADMLMRLCH